MNLSLKLTGHGGHSQIDFSDGKIALEWKSTTAAERTMLSGLVEKAKSKGFKAPEGFSGSFDNDGSATLEGGSLGATLEIAEGAIKAEISSGKLVYDGDELVKIESLVIKQKEKQVVVSSPVPVGG